MDLNLKIFNFDCLARYLRIFNFLWRVKRMEYTTCATWKSHKADMEKFRTMPGKIRERKYFDQNGNEES